jgi:hypothetical protein
MDHKCLGGGVVYTCRRFSKKCHFKGTCKISKLFHPHLWGLNLPAGSNTLQIKILWGYQIPQNKVLQGIRPHLRFCGVSDPTEQGQHCVHFIEDACSVGPDSPRNMVLILQLTTSCGVSDLTEQSLLAGYQTPGNNF